jgi:ribonuclease BN (tRNA processing enzyme)
MSRIPYLTKFYEEFNYPTEAAESLLRAFAEVEKNPLAKETFHTTAMQAAQIARDAGAKRLVIGHFSARYENEDLLLKESQSVFPDTVLAKENLRLIL